MIHSEHLDARKHVNLKHQMEILAARWILDMVSIQSPVIYQKDMLYFTNNRLYISHRRNWKLIERIISDRTLQSFKISIHWNKKHSNTQIFRYFQKQLFILLQVPIPILQQHSILWAFLKVEMIGFQSSQMLLLVLVHPLSAMMWFVCFHKLKIISYPREMFRLACNLEIMI